MTVWWNWSNPVLPSDFVFYEKKHRFGGVFFYRRKGANRLEEKNEHSKELRRKAMKLPLHPGVYLMHDKTGTIIYVGKAKALKNRVSQYFGSPKNHPAKVRRMVSQVDWFEVILCDSEFEALVLECSLIKQYRPKYNILLKDDKGYHYIRISSGDWPRITEAKQVLDDGASYVGPYVSSWAVRQSIDEARKIFQLPSCNRRFPQEIGKGRPCLNYFIKQCSAPCRGKITAAEYQEQVRQALDFLEGGSAAAVRKMTEEMNEAAENLEFERAARLRDRLSAVRKMTDQQKVVASSVPEQDVIAMVQNDSERCFEVFRFQNGRLCDRETFFVKEGGTDREARSGFLQQYYGIRDRVPPRVTLDDAPEDRELLAEWLSRKAGRKVQIHVPQKGEQKQLIDMCRTNAAEQLAQRSGRNTGRETAALDELARLLGLEKPPVYLEAYDISNLGGSENVAGMVVFENGRPLKSAYRKFKIKTVAGQDDYGSMREVIARRLAEYRKDPESGEGFGRLPDCILLDGGKGHVAAIEPLVREMGFSIPVFGMVKDDKHRTRAIAADGGEVAIQSNRSAFTLIGAIQEEVHRYAIGFHRQQRSKTNISSTLTSIEGVGITRARSLLKHFGTIAAIRRASTEELRAAPGMTRPAAEKVYRALHEDEFEGES